MRPPARSSPPSHRTGAPSLHLSSKSWRRSASWSTRPEEEEEAAEEEVEDVLRSSVRGSSSSRPRTAISFGLGRAGNMDRGAGVLCEHVFAMTFCLLRLGERG